jgi:hypothetical protein
MPFDLPNDINFEPARQPGKQERAANDAAIVTGQSLILYLEVISYITTTFFFHMG